MLNKAPLILPLLISCAFCFADPLEEAEKLREEAMAVLKSNSQKQATPEEYAGCIMKLEKARALLDSSGNGDSPAAQSVNAGLFWAKKFSNIAVMNALEKMRAAAPAPATPPKKVATPAVRSAAPLQQKAGETPEQARMREAQAAYTATETFAKEHAGDQYLVALRWFQFASEYPGTDYTLKALEFARQSQKEFAAATQKTSDPAEALPDTAQYKTIKDADKLVKTGHYDQAFAAYRAFLTTDDNMVVHRKFARALFACAQALNDKLKPRFDEHVNSYGQAYEKSWVTNNNSKFFNPDSPALRAWKNQMDALRKEKDGIMKYYADAETELKAILRLAPEHKDFEAAGYLGLSQTVRPFFKMQGLQTLQDFVKSYQAENDDQRTLYQFCKSEIERVRSGH